MVQPTLNTIGVTLAWYAPIKTKELNSKYFKIILDSLKKHDILGTSRQGLVDDIKPNYLKLKLCFTILCYIAVYITSKVRQAINNNRERP